ncbi:C69 family dipeptidase [Limobrevibacterium gyesilva]|uniref:Dipeptidase n=1 Tax=Limobrevibacterium gyesilva TaxID=2991712 RepID=A0AA41YQ11_9PROT|nr:C69 family dipeptidase [Limobrevibacterium gyesilva]MCW3474518.1 C69 family dipeptidase [Limobrevibacterium gyesilva]
MCDTMAARAAATATGGTLFAKNSDRERNEAQFLELNPARRYGSGAVLRATYITVPQAARTHAVLLSRPFWIWGAEMGANEHGVVIGNEAVHPRALPQRQPALLGMDLLRLGLERGATAAAAVEVITALLEQYGQGGNCSHLARRYYDNSFIVADRNEVYVLETVGRRWAVERAPAVRAISNTYTIGTDITRASADLEAFARAQGWWRGETFDFAAAVTDPGNPGLPVARTRCTRATELLGRDAGRLTAAHMMAFLRDHGAEAGAGWHPQDATRGSICMHAADGTRRGQSVGSFVSDLRAAGAVHWVTGTSAPCTGVFKPVFLEDGLPDHGPQPGDLYDPETLWWRHEALHRAMLTDGADAAIGAERDALEARFAERVEPLLGRPGPARRAAVEQCWREATEAEARWLRHVRSRARLRPAYRASWARHDRLAGAALTCTPAPHALAAE